MKHRIFTDNGYIVSVTHYAKDGNIGDAEYARIMDAIANKPIPPSGYDYRLKESLEWELYELPIVDDEAEAEMATEADYQDALERLGVNFNA